MSGIKIGFEWDSKDLEVFRGKKLDVALARAMRLAGNQAAKALQQGTIKLIRSKKNLSEATVTDDQTRANPTRSDELKDFAWSLFIRGKPVPVSKFPYVDTRRLRSGNGVLARFGTGGTTRLTGGFIATMESGHVGVFRRSSTKRMKSDPRKWAINQLFSSRLPKDLGGEILISLADPVYRKLETAFKRGLDREFAKLKRKGTL